MATGAEGAIEGAEGAEGAPAGFEAATANAQEWLRLLFHSLTCPTKGQGQGQCAIHKCRDAKKLWECIFHGSGDANVVASIKVLLLHYTGCTQQVRRQECSRVCSLAKKVKASPDMTGSCVCIYTQEACLLCGPIRLELAATGPATPPNTDTGSGASSNRLAAVAGAAGSATGQPAAAVEVTPAGALCWLIFKLLDAGQVNAVLMSEFPRVSPKNLFAEKPFYPPPPFSALRCSPEPAPTWNSAARAAASTGSTS